MCVCVCVWGGYLCEGELVDALGDSPFCALHALRVLGGFEDHHVAALNVYATLGDAGGHVGVLRSQALLRGEMGNYWSSSHLVLFPILLPVSQWPDAQINIDFLLAVSLSRHSSLHNWFLRTGRNNVNSVPLLW